MAARVSEWHGDAVFNSLFEKMEKNANSVGLHLRNSVKKNINVGATSVVGVKSGRENPGQKTGETRSKHPNPGGFPRKDTGVLFGSIDYKVYSSKKGKSKGRGAGVVVIIGAHTEYAIILELGNQKTGAHFPFLIPTVDQEKLKIVGLLSRGLF